MKFAVFNLGQGERLKCNICGTMVKGVKKQTKIYLREATRADPPAIGEVVCKECLEKKKVELEGSGIEIFVVNEDE
jgi:hypothetical protein